jgi:hypothetical protein
MSKGLGRIEREILRKIEDAHEPRSDGTVGAVHVHSWEIVHGLFAPLDTMSLDWSPSIAQRTAVSRAMRSFVRKHPQYALAGGKGRKMLYLFEPGDPVSAMWAKMSVESRYFITKADALRKLRSERP